MEDLNATLNSILSDPNKIEQLRQVAVSLGIHPDGGPGSGQTSQPGASNSSGIDTGAIASILQNLQAAGGASQAGQDGTGRSSGGTAGGFNVEMISKISQIMNTFNQNDKNVDLLRSLKPHFSPARAGKIDDAIRIMQLIRVWPVLRDSGLLGSLSNLLGGGGKT